MSADPQQLTEAFLKGILTTALMTRTAYTAVNQLVDMNNVTIAGVYLLDISNATGVLNLPPQESESYRGILIVGSVAGCGLHAYFSQVSPVYITYRIRWFGAWNPWRVFMPT